MLKPLDISITQYSLLSSINKLQSCTANELAIHAGLERTTVIRTLKPLLKKGFVTDCKNETKKRNFMLSAMGAEVLNSAKPLWQTAQKNLEDRFGADKLMSLVDIASSLSE